MRHLTIFANALLKDTSPPNFLQKAAGPLLSREGGPIQATHVGSDSEIPELEREYWLNIYDVQVSLCELSQRRRGAGEQHVLPARQPALLKGPLLHHRGPKTQPKLHTIGPAERQLVCFNSILFVQQRLRDFANMP